MVRRTTFLFGMIISFLVGILLVTVTVLLLQATGRVEFTVPNDADTNNDTDNNTDDNDDDDNDVEPTDVDNSGDDVDLAPYILTSSKGVKLTVGEPKNRHSVSCPINLKGKVSGAWYFEAIFGYKLLDKNGNKIAEGFVTAVDDWMTTDEVRFEGEITCPANYTGKATIVFEKDNASGLPENDDSAKLEIVIE